MLLSRSPQLDWKWDSMVSRGEGRPQGLARRTVGVGRNPGWDWTGEDMPGGGNELEPGYQVQEASLGVVASTSLGFS